MQKDVALALLDEFLKYNGYEDMEEGAEGEDNWHGVSPSVSFRFYEDTGEVKFYAPIQVFNEQQPPAGIVEYCEQAARSGTVDMGGGQFELDPKDNGLYLTRIYKEPLPVQRLTEDVVRLQDAANRWDGEVMDRAYALIEGTTGSPS